jgi:signal transduction histidine kinase
MASTKPEPTGARGTTRSTAVGRVPDATEAREVGIPAIGRAPWGTHFCQFYHTGQDLIDTLVPYFRAGLEHNELCMWVTADPLNAQQATRAMREAVPNFDTFMDRGQIDIVPYDHWYLRNGVFEPDWVLAAWAQKAELAQLRGFDGLRVTGNTFWLEQSQWADFTDYEATVNGVIGSSRMIALCSYSLERCGVMEVIDVLTNHQFALIKRNNQWITIEPTSQKQAAEAVTQLDRKLRQQAAERDEALDAVRTVRRWVTQDLNTPAHEIRTLAARLEREPSNSFDPHVRHDLKKISHDARIIDELSRQLLSSLPKPV